MNKLLTERLVEIESEEDIDRLNPRSVVFVKNRDPWVFDRREDDMLFFYYPNFLEKDVVEERKIPRNYVGNSGNMIYFMFGEGSKVKDLTSLDGEYYTERRDDLVALGLMK